MTSTSTYAYSMLQSSYGEPSNKPRCPLYVLKVQEACACCAKLLSQVLAIDQRRASEEVIMYAWDATDAKPVCAR